MTLNKTGIEWCDYTYNPVTGCKHGCEFCYARGHAENPFYKKGFPNKFEPTFHPGRLTDPERKKATSTIFVVSMGELFGDWVPQEWIDCVVRSCVLAPQHTYIFLTKNPWRMREYLYNLSAGSLENWWVGTSLGESRNSWARLPSIQMLGKEGWNTFLSIEPLKVAPLLFSHVSLKGIKQVIIGMQTKPLTPCEPEVIEDVVNIAKKNYVPIFLKDSTLSCFGRSIVEPSRELCWEVHK